MRVLGGMLPTGVPTRLCLRKRIQAAVRVAAVQEMGRWLWLGTAVKGRLEVTGKAGPGTRVERGGRDPGCRGLSPGSLTYQLCGFGQLT